MKHYQLIKLTEPRLVVSSLAIEAIIDVLFKYIPLKQRVEALLSIPSHIDIDRYTNEDDINLLLCTEAGCDFLFNSFDINDSDYNTLIGN